jgi:hypothetical protein
MNCPNCGTALPNGARFCYSCGRNLGGGAASPAPPPAAPAPPTAAPASASGPTELKCKSCGAPLHPVFGDMVVTCEYCGASISLAGGSWKDISKHSMLVPKVTEQPAALQVIRGFLDQGMFHRHDFEESQVVESRLSFVPFWVVSVSASTTYQYQDMAASIGGTVATMAAAELLGNALERGRSGGIMPFPVVMGPAVNPTRSESISKLYEYPVVAVKGMTNYQPRNYEFNLSERSFFDKKAIPSTAQVLNGDLGEDAAKNAAQAYVMEAQSAAAHAKHHMVSSLNTTSQVADAELLHVPIWYFLLDHKGEKHAVLVDAQAGRVIQTVSG